MLLQAVQGHPWDSCQQTSELLSADSHLAFSSVLRELCARAQSGIFAPAALLTGLPQLAHVPQQKGSSTQMGAVFPGFSCTYQDITDAQEGSGVEAGIPTGLELLQAPGNSMEPSGNTDTMGHRRDKNQSLKGEMVPESVSDRTPPHCSPNCHLCASTEAARAGGARDREEPS